MTYADDAGPAIQRVAAAVANGTLTKAPCAICGRDKVEAHHPNGYDADHALDVVWLCRTHHSAVHHPKILLTVPEAAAALGLKPSTLRHQIKNGKLAARKVSRDWYLTAEEVERYRKENRR